MQQSATDFLYFVNKMILSLILDAFKIYYIPTEAISVPHMI